MRIGVALLLIRVALLQMEHLMLGIVSTCPIGDLYNSQDNE